MTRWYKGFRCARIQPDSLVKQIKEQLQRRKLTNNVPVIRAEKQKHRKRQRGEYYLFLAIESEYLGQIPDSVQSALQGIPALKRPLDAILTFEQIKDMVKAEYNLETYDNIRVIPYRTPPPQPSSDPFAQEEELPTAMQEGDVLLRTQRYNRLLLWLSAFGKEGSWRTFQNVCQQLGLVHKKSTPAIILRHLRLCGHIETSPDRKQWTIAPSSLVKREQSDNSNNDDEYVLCGARDIRMVQQLGAISRVSEHPQPYGYAPAVITVQTDDLDRVKSHFSDSNHPLHVVGSIAYRLAERLPSLDGWMDTLQLFKLTDLSPYQFFVQRFTGKHFEDEPFDDKKSGLYELWHDEPPAQTHAFSSVYPDYTLFYDAEKQRWLRGDWYGMRFLALQLFQDHCPVRYNPSDAQLAIPQDWHLPELYERALVLASGQLPRYKDDWLIYESISQRIFDALAPKLHLTIQERDNNYA